MLTEAQRRSFFDEGYLPVAGALSASEVDAMHERVWRRLERNGAARRDPTTWSPGAMWHLQAVRRRDPEPGASEPLRRALDAIFGESGWCPPRDWGQVLVTFPTEEDWSIPRRPWHLDHPYEFAGAPVSGVNIFLFVDDVQPRGGGTLVIESSPRLIARYVESIGGVGRRTHKQLRNRFDASHPWLRALTSDGGGDRVAAFMDASEDLDGIRARVVELTGRAGDAVICHPHAIHNSSPNVLDRPRMMRAARVYSPAFLDSRGVSSARLPAGP